MTWSKSVEDLGMVKSIIVEVVKDDGASVLNAENEIVMQHQERAKGRIILFALDPENEHIKKHVEEDGVVVVVVNDNIVVRNKHFDKIIASVNEVPITFWRFC